MEEQKYFREQQKLQDLLFILYIIKITSVKITPNVINWQLKKCIKTFNKLLESGLLMNLLNKFDRNEKTNS